MDTSEQVKGPPTGVGVVIDGASTRTPQLSARVEGFDLARALAFLGMVFVNFRVSIADERSGPRWLVWLVTRLDGRASATFVVLAGVGIALVSRRARESGDGAALAAVRGLLLRRAAFLFVVGLLYWPLWPADILHYYGAYIAIGAMLLDAPGHRLWTIALVLTGAFALLLVLGLDYSAGWDWETLTYHGFWTPSGFARNLLYNGFHPILPWLAFLLVGMWLGRRDVHDLAAWRRLALCGIATAALAETTSWLLVRAASSHLDQADAAAVFGTAPMPPMPFYMLAATATAVAVIALSVLAARRHAVACWLKPLVATGQLALTLYVAHVVIGIVPLEALGFLEGRRSVTFSVGWASAFCTGAILFADLWRRRFARGPLEMLMRWFAPG
jgi:uncharacterized protein